MVYYCHRLHFWEHYRTVLSIKNILLVSSMTSRSGCKYPVRLHLSVMRNQYYIKHVCFNAAFRRKLLNQKGTKKTQCRKSNQWCNFLLLASIVSKKKASFAFRNTLYGSAFAKNKRATVRVPHFFLSFCFLSGLLLCSVVMLRGMRRTPSGPYCRKYSLAE